MILKIVIRTNDVKIRISYIFNTILYKIKLLESIIFVTVFMAPRIQLKYFNDLMISLIKFFISRFQFLIPVNNFRYF